jgi:DNA-binding FadR family transcriptional regulator
MPKSFGTNRGQRDLGNAIRSHHDDIEDAIKTGDMEKVKQANRKGYSRERREVKDYARMK